jgi:hypothetical protein
VPLPILEFGSSSEHTATENPAESGNFEDAEVAVQGALSSTSSTMEVAVPEALMTEVAVPEALNSMARKAPTTSRDPDSAKRAVS